MEDARRTVHAFNCFSLLASRRIPLGFVANRDENYARPSAPIYVWEGLTFIHGGTRFGSLGHLVGSDRTRARALSGTDQPAFHKFSPSRRSAVSGKSGQRVVDLFGHAASDGAYL